MKDIISWTRPSVGSFICVNVSYYFKYIKIKCISDIAKTEINLRLLSVILNEQK